MVVLAKVHMRKLHLPLNLIPLSVTPPSRHRYFSAKLAYYFSLTLVCLKGCCSNPPRLFPIPALRIHTAMTPLAIPISHSLFVDQLHVCSFARSPVLPHRDSVPQASTLWP